MTRSAYKIEPGWACRAEPGSGVGDVPQPGAAFPLPRLYRINESVAAGVADRVAARRPEKSSNTEDVAVVRSTEEWGAPSAV